MIHRGIPLCMLKNGEFCITNDGFCIVNDEFRKARRRHNPDRGVQNPFGIEGRTQSRVDSRPESTGDKSSSGMYYRLQNVLL